MEIIIRFLQENPVQFLATIGMDGKPKVRPFKFRLEEDNRLWFCTSNRKDVYNELKNHPHVELSVASPRETWIRLAGIAVFENNLAVKQKMIDSDESLRAQYRTADNPVFEVFYIDQAVATIAAFTGLPPKKFFL
ncbi:pyridoxamine 5'-phosphate oxidase family protein [Oxalobacter aliiformigenes]|uniref:pyridoxamine 5'-phosphate oxidase family protein n=1 Tax=Oxalobacter aliiformigenes TaxID=2946593 RepID=UPI0022AF14B4|nr:pyridoxamine 5'-phosphate oxidase family protein [Oxalobacter aliiformigenes]MCZ4065149.1 pyridoxamine 5'-phosphate oxidase family protein [Oxalobacter aliiformigenes]WAV98300.1 pyridoxamine 5'-phosphate oxidase family protein [Oxalobacter aliiformigenes]